MKKDVSPRKKKRKVMMRRKRTLEADLIIDYKHPDVLKRFITDRGKIIPRRISGATQQQQRRITTAIKRARQLALLPYSIAHETERGFGGEMQTVAQAFAVPFRGRSGQRGPNASGGRFQSAPGSNKENREQQEN